MNKELLKETFREYKKAAGLDYAITNPDSLGSCMSDVNYSLCEKYGVDSKGIWAKHWSRGMNASGGVESAKYAYIAHDITPEQADIFYKVMGQYYTVLPETYNPSSCFRLFEKGTDIYEVSYMETFCDGTKHRFSDEYTSEEGAMKRVSFLLSRMNGGRVSEIKITKIA